MGYLTDILQDAVSLPALAGDSKTMVLPESPVTPLTDMGHGDKDLRPHAAGEDAPVGAEKGSKQDIKNDESTRRFSPQEIVRREEDVAFGQQEDQVDENSKSTLEQSMQVSPLVMSEESAQLSDDGKDGVNSPVFSVTPVHREIVDEVRAPGDTVHQTTYEAEASDSISTPLDRNKSENVLTHDNDISSSENSDFQESHFNFSEQSQQMDTSNQVSGKQRTPPQAVISTNTPSLTENDPLDKISPAQPTTVQSKTAQDISTLRQTETTASDHEPAGENNMAPPPQTPSLQQNEYQRQNKTTTPEPPPPLPQLQIGQINVLISSPEPNSSLPLPALSSSSLHSRRYERRLA